MKDPESLQTKTGMVTEDFGAGKEGISFTKEDIDKILEESQHPEEKLEIPSIPEGLFNVDEKGNLIRSDFPASEVFDPFNSSTLGNGLSMLLIAAWHTRYKAANLARKHLIGIQSVLEKVERFLGFEEENGLKQVTELKDDAKSLLDLILQAEDEELRAQIDDYITSEFKKIAFNLSELDYLFQQIEEGDIRGSIISRIGPFFEGMMDSFKAAPDKTFQTFIIKLEQSNALYLFLPQFFIAGAAHGIVKNVYDDLKFLLDVIAEPGIIIDLLDSAQKLVDDLTSINGGDIAKKIGNVIGTQVVKEISNLNKLSVFSFSYELGKVIGPAIVEVALSMTPLGVYLASRRTLFATRLANRLEPLLRHLPASKSLKKKTAQIAERTKLDSPDGKSKSLDLDTSKRDRSSSNGVEGFDDFGSQKLDETKADLDLDLDEVLGPLPQRKRVPWNKKNLSLKEKKVLAKRYRKNVPHSEEFPDTPEGNRALFEHLDTYRYIGKRRGWVALDDIGSKRPQPSEILDTVDFIDRKEGLSPTIDEDTIPSAKLPEGTDTLIDRPKGSPPLEQKIQGELAEHRHASEITGEPTRPPSPVKQIGHKRFAELQLEIAGPHPQITLREFAENFPEGASEVALLTKKGSKPGKAGKRIIDHMFLDGDFHVVLRESKNVNELRLGKNIGLQLEKDLEILNIHPDAKLEWRIDGKLHPKMKREFDRLKKKFRGRFKYDVKPKK